MKKIAIQCFSICTALCLFALFATLFTSCAELHSQKGTTLPRYDKDFYTINNFNARDFDETDIYYSLFSKKPPKEANRIVQNPDANIYSVTYTIGELPFYDFSFCFAKEDKLIDIIYETSKFHYVAAVFSFTDENDLKLLSENRLDFAAIDEIKSNICALFGNMGIKIKITDCRSLNGEELQSIYDNKKAKNNLHDGRYGTDGSPVKNRSSTAEKENWSDEDSFYYIDAKQIIEGRIFDESRINILIDREDIFMISCDELVFSYDKGQKVNIVTREYIESLAALKHGNSDNNIINSELIYQRKELNSASPIWKVSVNEDNAAGEKIYYYDAVTGTEISGGS